VNHHRVEAGARRPAGAAERIGRRIVTGDLAPGTILPNLSDLANEFSISRLSMREAMKLLAGKGLVSSTPRRGTIVRPRSDWSRLDADVLVWQLGGVPNAAFVRNLFELRRMVEPEAAAFAATRGSSESLAAIERAFGDMIEAGSCTPESIAADVRLHQAILAATGNEFIAALAPAIETSLMLTFPLQRKIHPDPDNFIPSHRLIVDAIKRGDANAARKAVLALLVRAEKDALDGVPISRGKTVPRATS
jgi:GntR family galactonate operon transcriptional repressor